MQNPKSICSANDYYTDENEYKIFRNSNTKNIALSKLEHLIKEDMKLLGFNPTLSADVQVYWSSRIW